MEVAPAEEAPPTGPVQGEVAAPPERADMAGTEEAPAIESAETKLEADAQAAVAPEEEGEEEHSNLHLSCRDFQKVTSVKLQHWLGKRSQVRLQKVFKLPQWSYAFVTVAPEDVDKFREAVDGVNFRQKPVAVKEGHPRDANSRRPKGEEPPQKRQKVAKDFPEGYVPTLKDLKDRFSKQQKGESVLARSAPLLQWSYETQLGMKATYIKSAVRALTKQVRKRCEDEARDPPPWTGPDWSLAAKAPLGCSCVLDDPIGTAEEYRNGYRNKCEFTIGKTESGEVEVGFVLKITNDGDQVVASCQDVPIVPEPMKKLCLALRDCIRSSPFEVYDRRRSIKQGVWRVAMVRLSPNGDMLLLVQVATLSAEDKEKLLGLLVDATSGLRVASLYLQFNNEVSDAARGDCELLHCRGAPTLEMPLCGLRFEIGPLSFFQANSATCELLYARALEWLCPSADALVLDVCCGVGTIGLCAAKRCRQVMGLELVPEAVESAKRNAALNSVSNACYHVGRAEEVLPGLLQELCSGPSAPSEVCAVVDPPRPGLHHQVLAALRSCQQLTRIVYVSCNPDSLVEDTVKLTVPRESGEDNFVPVRAVAVDMFPHTLHCEMILLLERASRVKDPRAQTDAAQADAKE